MVCYCEVYTDPTNLLGTFANLSAGLSTYPGDNSVSIDLSSTTKGVIVTLGKPDLSNIISKKSRALLNIELPKTQVASILTITSLDYIFQPNLNITTFNYTLSMNWEDTVNRIVLQVDKRDNKKGAQTISIVESRIMNRNYSNIHTHCSSQNTALKLCDCIVDS